MPIVPFIPAIIGAGATIYGAHAASSATSDAAQTSAGATEKALALQKEMFERQRADLGPYRETGYGALGNLRGLTGQPAMAMPGQGASLGPSLSGEPTYGWTPPASVGPNATSQTWIGPGPNPMFQPGTPGYAAQHPGSPAVAPPVATVKLRAPDGSMRDVPPDQVSHFLQKGAVQV